jgi:hypothetical protein
MSAFCLSTQKRCQASKGLFCYGLRNVALVTGGEIVRGGTIWAADSDSGRSSGCPEKKFRPKFAHYHFNEKFSPKFPEVFNPGFAPTEKVCAYD